MAQNGVASKVQKPTLNGNLPHSQTVNHVFSYPLIYELAITFQGTSIGALSINTYNELYQLFVDPLKPYLQGPYSIVGPYIKQADQLGSSSLETIDGHFPIFKNTDSETLKSYAYGGLNYPFQAANGGGNYVFNTYNDEYSKMQGQDGLFKSGKALISTELRMASDALHYVADFLGPKKNEIQANFDKLTKQGAETVDQVSKQGSAKFDQATKQGAETVDQVSKQGSQKFDQATKQGSEKAEQAKKQGAEKTGQVKSQLNIH